MRQRKFRGLSRRIRSFSERFFQALSDMLVQTSEYKKAVPNSDAASSESSVTNGHTTKICAKEPINQEAWALSAAQRENTYQPFPTLSTASKFDASLSLPCKMLHEMPFCLFFKFLKTRKSGQKICDLIQVVQDRWFYLGLTADSRWLYRRRPRSRCPQLSPESAQTGTLALGSLLSIPASFITSWINQWNSITHATGHTTAFQWGWATQLPWSSHWGWNRAVVEKG